MNIKELAYKTYKANQEFFDEKKINPSQMSIMYKIYYESLVNEIYNPNKKKYYIYQNELGVFKNSLVNWTKLLKKWQLKLRMSNLKKEEDPEKVIKFFISKVYFIIQNEIYMQLQYIEDVKVYLEYDKLTYEQVTEFYDVFGWVLNIGDRILKKNQKVKNIAMKRLAYFQSIKETKTQENYESEEHNEVASRSMEE